MEFLSFITIFIPQFLFRAHSSSYNEFRHLLSIAILFPFQCFITKLLETHHHQRLLLKIQLRCLESSLIDDSSVMIDLKERLVNSSRLVEDMVSVLQSNIPHLNQAKLIAVNDGLNLEDEIKWVNDVKQTIAKINQRFYHYEDFNENFTRLNVSQICSSFFILL